MSFAERGVALIRGLVRSTMSTANAEVGKPKASDNRLAFATISPGDDEAGHSATRRGASRQISPSCRRSCTRFDARPLIQAVKFEKSINQVPTCCDLLKRS
jgi:hypothetical protein